MDGGTERLQARRLFFIPEFAGFGKLKCLRAANCFGSPVDPELACSDFVTTPAAG
jgi:hypothetical protein